MPRRTPKGAAVTELILTMFLAHGRIMRGGDSLLSDLGLTGARWQVLGAIKDGPKTVAQIARRYELSRQGVLWIVQSLLEDGLVKYIDNPDHKRAKLLVFTERGKETDAEIERRQCRWSNDLGKAFDLEDLHAATQCVRRLGERIKDRDGDESDM